MNTYLFVWNPKQWEWKNIEKSIERIQLTGKSTERWSCGNTKSIKPGDRAFLVKVGTSPKGIIGTGVVSTNPFLEKHWGGENKNTHYVEIDFDVLLNPEKDEILTIDILKMGKLSEQLWTPQASGISIRPELVKELEAVWFDFLSTQKIRYNPFTSSGNENNITFIEGTPVQVVSSKYERNPFARSKCIEKYGLNCSVCNFNFQESYGDIGKDFIHVHHLNQISNIGEAYSIDPIKDLRPVCPNCHAMLHKQNPPLTIEELKEKLK